MRATAGEAEHGEAGSAPAGDLRTRPRRIARKEGRGTGRTARPQARPPRPLRNPQVVRSSAGSTISCRLPQPPVEAPLQPAGPPAMVSSWRLTERGIALVIATGLAIAMAALVVVGLTAFRVTADNFVPHGQVQATR